MEQQNANELNGGLTVKGEQQGKQSNMDKLTTLGNGENLELDKVRSLAAKQLCKREKIEGTPFEIVINEEAPEETRANITFGIYRVWKEVSEEEARKMIEERDWDLIANMAAVVAEQVFYKLEERRLKEMTTEEEG